MDTTAVTRSSVALNPETYAADVKLQPGDQLVHHFPDWTSSTTGVTVPAHEAILTVADPAYDEKDRVVIVEDAHGRVLGNRNAAPAVRRYKRDSKKLVGREIRRKGGATVVVIDNYDKELRVGALVLDEARSDYRGPAPKVVEITAPNDGSCIVKLGGQDAAPGEWSSMLFALLEPDGRFRASLKLLGHQRDDGSLDPAT